MRHRAFHARDVELNAPSQGVRVRVARLQDVRVRRWGSRRGDVGEGAPWDSARPPSQRGVGGRPRSPRWRFSPKSRRRFRASGAPPCSKGSGFRTWWRRQRTSRRSALRRWPTSPSASSALFGAGLSSTIRARSRRRTTAVGSTADAGAASAGAAATITTSGTSRIRRARAATFSSAAVRRGSGGSSCASRSPRTASSSVRPSPGCDVGYRRPRRRLGHVHRHRGGDRLHRRDPHRQRPGARENEKKDAVIKAPENKFRRSTAT